MAARRDLVVIGGGPTGTAAALAARARGLDVVLVAPRQRLARFLALRVLAQDLAVRPLSRAPAERADAGFLQAVRRAGEAAAALVDQRDGQLARSGVARLAGQARFTGRPGEVEVSLHGRSERIEATAVLLAVGARRCLGPGTTVAADAISDPALLLDTGPPASALVIGAGQEGVSLAGLLACAGSAVTLLEAQSRVLPRGDADVSAVVRRALESARASVQPGARVVALRRSGGRVEAELADGRVVAADAAYLTAGDAPAVANLAIEALPEGTLEALPVQTYATRLPWLFLAGTCAGRSLTTEAARREGRAAVAALSGGSEHVPHAAVPTVTVGVGGAGWSGWTEADAEAAGHVVLVGRAPLLGRGFLPPGFVKLVADRGSQRVLGVHVAGAQGGQAVALGAACVEFGWSRLDVAALSFPPESAAGALADAAATATA